MRTPTKDEIAQVVAEIAFGIGSITLTDFQRYAVQLFIEELVLTEDIESYTKTELYSYVLNYLR
ncbi:hypothetical protein [Paenibacillus sp. XY044]|uniref:hypothetical protein n=1 Tax=Paenibacillus sp. XY044 TaxID=2026089 RepID=UPI000B99B281|nr:hypothetical protein [Paenibacillus sp. XY044]OZB98142.1 hypothetical protein CJP46_02940 [Paenibacillus sp. XY044]